MTTMRILKDLDGCSFNFGENLHASLPKIGIPNDELPPIFDVWNFYERWGWDDRRFVDICHELADAGHLFVGKSEPGTVEAWQQIADAGHEVHVVTFRGFGRRGRGQASRDATLRYLLEEGFPFHSVTFSRDKTVVPCDMGLEDNLENYDALNRAGCEVWLIDRPWNQGPADEHRRRVSSVQEFADIVTARS